MQKKVLICKFLGRKIFVAEKHSRNIAKVCLSNFFSSQKHKRGEETHAKKQIIFYSNIILTDNTEASIHKTN